MLKKLGMLVVLMLVMASASTSAKDLLNDEELAKKMSDYYKSASDQEIDKFIIGLTNSKKSTLPQKINKSITLYKIEYFKISSVFKFPGPLPIPVIVESIQLTPLFIAKREFFKAKFKLSCA